jgi:Adenylate and Guanylate cyclase catalytic domain
LLLGFTTSKPIIFALSAAAFILFPFAAFLAYDRKVTRQQEEILSTANRSHAIVSSLFPSNVRDKLYSNQDPNSNASNSLATTNNNLTALMGPPIAELYPETTVLFADMVDFTKWSSGTSFWFALKIVFAYVHVLTNSHEQAVRDPSQVFTLLESVYCAFDSVAGRMKVFKVETVGDCYVAGMYP